MHDCKPDPNIPVVCLHVANLGIPHVKGMPDDLFVCKSCLKLMSVNDPQVQKYLTCVCRDCIKEHIILR